MFENALDNAHPSWKGVLDFALSGLSDEYKSHLLLSSNWLPGADKFLNAFSIPLEKVNYILVGESPYPRRESSCGFCFYDAAVGNLWGDNGFTKEVNRATSLRNLIKMMLVARGDLDPDNTTQSAIAELSKGSFVQTGKEMFIDGAVNKYGFLLLNYSLALTDGWNKNKEAREWKPFMDGLLRGIKEEVSGSLPTLILFGKIAEQVKALESSGGFPVFQCEHPYNISFITNPSVLGFFKGLDLLQSA